MLRKRFNLEVKIYTIEALFDVVYSMFFFSLIEEYGPMHIEFTSLLMSEYFREVEYKTKLFKNVYYVYHAPIEQQTFYSQPSDMTYVHI